MSSQVTSCRGNSTERVEQSTIPSRSPTNGHETSFVASDAIAVEMRNSSVGPITNGGTEMGGVINNKGAGQTDSSDGADLFTAESLAPLLSTNQYTMRKMAAQTLMDVALMMANISQLRTLITVGPDNMENFTALLSMVSISLACQLSFAVLIFIIWMRESEFQQREEYLASRRKPGDNTDAAEKAQRYSIREEAYRAHRITNYLNYITMVLVFIITVINMFITGFGIKLHS